MPNTVALLTVTGTLGPHLLKALGDQHVSGKIKLIALHRPDSDISNVPNGVETRVLDYESATAEDVAKALKGVEILVSSTSRTSDEANQRFCKSLAALSPPLRAFIPSDYSLNWTEGERNDIANHLLAKKMAMNDYATKAGLPLTIVNSGLFERFLWMPMYSGIDPKANTMSLYGDALNQRLPVTSLPYLAAGIVELVSGDAAALAGNHCTVIETETTGQEIADALTKAHAARPTITEFTDKEVEATKSIGPEAVLGACARKKWGSGSWPDEKEVKLFQPTGVKKKSIQDMVMDGLKTL